MSRIPTATSSASAAGRRQAEERTGHVRQGYVVGWGTLALINAGLAQSKGRSRLAWFLASLLLGPIATFIIVVTDTPAAKPAN